MNIALLNFIEEIMNIGASSTGDNFDATVIDKLQKNLPGATFIPTTRWCSTDKYSIFKEHNRLTQQYDFDFTKLPPLVDNGKPLSLMVVDKPNGSQKWPDMMVVFEGIGLPIEIKSSKTDNITWNSGTPKKNGLYIFNCYGKSRTTCFLGQHADPHDEVSIIKTIAAKAKDFVMEERRNHDGLVHWDFYLRNMFPSNQTFFENEALKIRMESTNNTIDTLVEKLDTATSEQQYTKLSSKLDAAKEKYQGYHKAYHRIRDTRITMETETQEYIKGLPWDSSQTTKFDNMETP